MVNVNNANKKINHTYMYKHNKQSVINMLLTYKGISRAEISNKLNFNKPSVSRIISGFLEKDIIIEKKGKNNKNLGKRPLGIYFNPDLKIIGFNIDASKIYVVVSDLYGDIAYKESIIVNDVSKIESQIIITLEKIKNFKLAKKYISICFSLPGVVDMNNIIYSQVLGVQDSNFPFVRKVFPDTPVVFANDVESALMSEIVFGDTNYDNGIYILFKTDFNNKILYIGASIISEGKILKGNNNYAGEILDLHLENKDIKKIKTFDDFFWEIDKRLVDLLVEWLSKYALFLNPEYLILGGDLYKEKNKLLRKKLVEKLDDVKEEFHKFDINLHVSSLRDWRVRSVVAPIIFFIKNGKIKLEDV